MFTTKTFLAAITMTVAAALPGMAADIYPSHPVRLIVGFPPGGPSDTISRIIGQKLGENIKQPIVVDNRPGGGGQIAVSALMQAPTDGYTLYVGDIGAFAINASLYEKFSFDPTRDFQPITTLVSMPMAVIVPEASPIKSFKDLVASAAKANPPMTFASPGIGTGAHILGEVFKYQTKAQVTHVPYKGSAASIQAIMASEVDFSFEGIGIANPYAKSGKVRFLTVADTIKSSVIPDVPTTVELGYPDLQLKAWYGLVAKVGTPAPIIDKLNREVLAVLADPSVIARLQEVGFGPMPGSPQELAALIKSDSARLGPIVKASGAKAQ